MSLMDEYVIPFYGLKEGIHEYDFEIDDSFFEYYQNQDIPGGELKIQIVLDKKSSLLELEFFIKGEMEVLCDRCLETFSNDVDIHEKLFFRFGEHHEELSDNLIVLGNNETRINVAEYLYEFAVLSLPIQKFHPENEYGESTCDKEMLKKLNEHKKNEDPANDDIDPRWEKLKNIKKNNK